jgi:hypothetical protein
LFFYVAKLIWKWDIIWIICQSCASPLKGNFVIFYMLAKYVPGDIKYIFTKFYQHISTNGLWRFSPIIALWDWNLKSGSLMLNLLHLKRSEDCNLNLITIGKLNTEVNSYVPFWQTTISNEQNVSFPLYLQRKECFTTVTYIHYM